MNVVNKIFLGTKQEAFNEILKKYKKQGFVIINFIYFASLSRYILKDKNKKYLQALQKGDFLLPDGIALKIYLSKKFNKHVKENLNGTDFTPYFLSNLNGSKHIAFYTVYDEKIGKSIEDAKKVKNYIQEKFNPNNVEYFISHYKNRGKNFNFNKYRQSLSRGDYNYKIFLVGLGSPFQEIWIQEYKNFFKENNTIVLNVGGLFDFWAGFEKRAPKLVRQLKLEWLWRLGQNPKKNWTKVKESFNLFREII